MALCVALCLAVLPAVSHQAMASHHAVEAVKTAAVHSHDAISAKPCDKQQGSKADKDQAGCCDISCSSFTAFGVTSIPALGGALPGHFQINADELDSRIVSGLKRPPRA